MLSFLRQIKKTLLEQNKTRSYLLYAFGEVTLVMIGILLALQVNNWNEDRLKSSEEQRIILDIISEAKEAKMSREEIINQYEGERIKLSKSLDKLFTEDSISISNEECTSIFRSHILRWNPLNISTLEEIVTSGKISIIKDVELRKRLVEFRNTSISNDTYLGQTIFEANVLVDHYPNLIIRDWSIHKQQSVFKCDKEAMRKNRYFIAQLQSNHGRMNAPIETAKEELLLLERLVKLAKEISN